MKNLLYKEIKLVIHPVAYLLTLLAALMLIPAYPYIVGTSYIILGIFTTFNNARMNNDHFFTALLPVPRNQIVLSKHLSVVFLELLQVVVAIPFALLTSFVLNKGGNLVGLDANFAFFGILFICFGAFNIIFLPNYFKSGYKAGIPLLFGTIAYILIYGIFEAMNYIVPAYGAAVDSLAPETIVYRLIILAVGIVFYAATIVISYFRSVKNFEGVNL